MPLSSTPSRSPCHKRQLRSPTWEGHWPVLPSHWGSQRKPQSYLSKGKHCVRSSPPSGKISIYLIMQSSLASPSLSLLPPFQNTFLALPLYNQRPIRVLFPKTKEQFLLKDEFSPHFEGGFSAFCYQGFQKHGIEFFLLEYVLQGSSALWGVIISIGVRIVRRTLEIKQLLQPPRQPFQEEHHN